MFMDAFTLFSLLTTWFEDDQPTGCDKLGPYCRCENNPVTRVTCAPPSDSTGIHNQVEPPAESALLSFSALHARKLTDIDLSGFDLKLQMQQAAEPHPQSISVAQPFKGALISPTGVKINMADTHLDRLHSDFFEGIAETIESLDVRDNLIKSVQGRFHKFQRLESLYLQNNRLNHFPAEICEAERLKYVNLRDNPIKSSDWSLQVNSLIKCDSLKKVYTDAYDMSCSCDRLQHYFFYHEHRGLPLFKDETGLPLSCSLEHSAHAFSGRSVDSLRQSEVCSVCECVAGGSAPSAPTPPSLSSLISLLALLTLLLPHSSPPPIFS